MQSKSKSVIDFPATRRLPKRSPIELEIQRKRQKIKMTLLMRTILIMPVSWQSYFSIVFCNASSIAHHVKGWLRVSLTRKITSYPY